MAHPGVNMVTERRSVEWEGEAEREGGRREVTVKSCYQILDPGASSVGFDAHGLNGVASIVCWLCRASCSLLKRCTSAPSSASRLALRWCKRCLATWNSAISASAVPAAVPEVEPFSRGNVLSIITNSASACCAARSCSWNWSWDDALAASLAVRTSCSCRMDGTAHRRLSELR